MKDIPLFQTEYGVASLGLSQVDRRQEAYVRLQAVSELAPMLAECIGFCRACGADRVFCTGASELEQYPLETAILQYSGTTESLPQSDACLWPVTEETVSAWREIYNRRMAKVPHAALYSAFDEKELVACGSCYFVHRAGKLLGIGQAEGDTVHAIIAEVPGAGAEVLAALATLLVGDSIRLEVASANLPAVRLYERLGFIPIKELDRWYQIF